MYLAGEAGVIDINGTVIVELITFLIMLALLARFVFPIIVRLAEERQRLVAEQLSEAEKARAEAEAKLKDAQAKLDDARKTAQGVIDAAGKSAEQLRAEMKDKAEAEAKRIADAAAKQIEVERDKAIQAVRGEVADLVVEATQKVLGEAIDSQTHRKLIDKAIAEVASGNGRG